MSAQRLRRWSNSVEMSYKCFVFTGKVRLFDLPIYLFTGVDEVKLTAKCAGALKGGAVGMHHDPHIVILVDLPNGPSGLNTYHCLVSGQPHIIVATQDVNP